MNELKLTGRNKLVYNWIPKKVNNLLDAGCNFGYATYHFKNKCENCFGFDPSVNDINKAKKLFNNINFQVSFMEKTNYNSDFFDVIILADVFEHVKDEIKSLNEIYRILKDKGTLIITVPHKGLFSIFDPTNFIFYFRKYFSQIYDFLFFLKNKKKPGKSKPGWDSFHRHYSYKNLYSLLMKSSFNDQFIVEKVHKSSLFIGVLTMYLDIFLSLLFNKPIRDKILLPFHYLSNIDYKIKYGLFSYDLAIKIKKCVN
ncbi:hypothetical protein C0585_07605 [Candidatus Woesearchaeota archaeon]|nr:MAG: hypothetical protein C0585_07605 [Candidatus Woesearchaeota archaeon]